MIINIPNAIQNRTLNQISRIINHGDKRSRGELHYRKPKPILIFGIFKGEITKRLLIHSLRKHGNRRPTTHRYLPKGDPNLSPTRHPDSPLHKKVCTPESRTSPKYSSK